MARPTAHFPHISDRPKAVGGHGFSLPAAAGLPALRVVASRGLGHLKRTAYLSSSPPTASCAVTYEGSSPTSQTMSSTREAACEDSSAFQPSTFDSELSVTPLESALTDELRVGFQGLYLQTLTEKRPGIGRTCFCITPLDSALTDTPPISPLESALAKKMGGG